MNLTLSFLASLYALLSLSALILAASSEMPFPALLTLPVAAVAFAFNERQKLLQLPSWLANVIGIGVLIVTALRVVNAEEVLNRLLAGADLLVYMSWVVLFQAKSTRHYWWLAALSLLQVSVAAVLSSSAIYGILLLAFLFLAVWTLSLFALYQGALEFLGAERLANRQLSDWGSWSTPPWRTVRSNGSHGRHGAHGKQAANIKGAGPGPFRMELPRSRVRNAIQHDQRARWITPRFVGGIVSIAFLGMLLGVQFFFLVPRFWMGELVASGGSRSETGLPVPTMTGFSGDVRLGDMGTILESSQPVIKFQLFNHFDETPISVEEFCARYQLDSLVFRGIVLDSYENGRWLQNDKSGLFTVMSTRRPDHCIRQEYTLYPTGSNVLFTLSPYYAGRVISGADRRMPVRGTTSVVQPPRPIGGQTLEYCLYSPLQIEELDGMQDRPSLGGKMSYDRMPPAVQELYLRVPERLERMQQLAQQVASAENPQLDSRLSEARRKADALVFHLRDSGLYQYSLEAGINDPTIDPVEDFLFNRKTGHCEYYASTLALMLRSAQIPSRMITGFKGAVSNPLAGFHEVQQRHAHAWVEAWLDDQWVTLDATPSSREEGLDLFAQLSWFEQLQSTLSNFWSEYVVMLDQTKQDQAFFDPLGDKMIDAGKDLTRRGQGLSALWKMVKFALGRPDRLFSLPGLIIIFCLGLLISGVVWFSRFLVRQLLNWQRLTAAGRRDGSRISVPFFERFLKVLEPLGLKPRPEQTAAEFAGDVVTEIQLRHGVLPIDLPARLTQRYHELRFGGETVAPQELAEWERLLDEFELRCQELLRIEQQSRPRGRPQTA